jgi:hypothetical protein
MLVNTSCSYWVPAAAPPRPCAMRSSLARHGRAEVGYGISVGAGIW